jgi:opacity protein-like surface antigen
MMLKKLTLTTYILIGMAALTGVAAFAQDTPAPAPQPTRASGPGYHQFDIGGSFYKTFVSSSSGMGMKQTPSDGMGGLIEGRYLLSPLVGFEMAVSFNTGGQAYAPIPGACALTCNNPAVKIGGRQVETSLDWVPSMKVGNFRPFLVGGLGVFISVPDSTPLGNNTSIRGAYIYGGGVEYDLGAHLGIRGQYRGTLYKAPNISSIYPANGQYTQTTMPSGGIYYRF